VENTLHGEGATREAGSEFSLDNGKQGRYGQV
jgi:hypothetical protein